MHTEKPHIDMLTKMSKSSDNIKKVVGKIGLKLIRSESPKEVDRLKGMPINQRTVLIHSKIKIKSNSRNIKEVCDNYETVKSLMDGLILLTDDTDDILVLDNLTVFMQELSKLSCEKIYENSSDIAKKLIQLKNSKNEIQSQRIIDDLYKLSLN